MPFHTQNWTYCTWTTHIYRLLIQPDTYWIIQGLVYWAVCLGSAGKIGAHGIFRVTSTKSRMGIPQAAFQHVSNCLRKHKMEQASSGQHILSVTNMESKNLRTRTIYLQCHSSIPPQWTLLWWLYQVSQALGYVQSAREFTAQVELNDMQPVFFDHLLYLY